MYPNQRQNGSRDRSGGRQLWLESAAHSRHLPVRTHHVDRPTGGELSYRRKRLCLRSVRVQRGSYQRAVAPVDGQPRGLLRQRQPGRHQEDTENGPQAEHVRILKPRVVRVPRDHAPSHRRRFLFGIPGLQSILISPPATSATTAATSPRQGGPQVQDGASAGLGPVQVRRLYRATRRLRGVRLKRNYEQQQHQKQDKHKRLLLLFLMAAMTSSKHHDPHHHPKFSHFKDIKDTSRMFLTTNQSGPSNNNKSNCGSATVDETSVVFRQDHRKRKKLQRFGSKTTKQERWKSKKRTRLRNLRLWMSTTKRIGSSCHRYSCWMWMPWRTKTKPSSRRRLSMDSIYNSSSERHRLEKQQQYYPSPKARGGPSVYNGEAFHCKEGGAPAEEGCSVTKQNHWAKKQKRFVVGHDIFRLSFSTKTLRQKKRYHEKKGKSRTSAERPPSPPPVSPQVEQQLNPLKEEKGQIKIKIHDDGSSSAYRNENSSYNRNMAVRKEKKFDSERKTIVNSTALEDLNFIHRGQRDPLIFIEVVQLLLLTWTTTQLVLTLLLNHHRKRTAWTNTTSTKTHTDDAKGRKRKWNYFLDFSSHSDITGKNSGCPRSVKSSRFSGTVPPWLWFGLVDYNPTYRSQSPLLKSLADLIQNRQRLSEDIVNNHTQIIPSTASQIRAVANKEHNIARSPTPASVSSVSVVKAVSSLSPEMIHVFGNVTKVVEGILVFLMIRLGHRAFMDKKRNESKIFTSTSWKDEVKTLPQLFHTYSKQTQRPPGFFNDDLTLTEFRPTLVSCF